MADLIREALERLQEYAAAHPEHDTGELVAAALAVLAAEPPAPDPREVIAVRPLLEAVVALDVWGVEIYDGRLPALQHRIRAWLAENPPGQPVAIEPRGCPTPGACSCVEPPAPAPADHVPDAGNMVAADGKREDLLERLRLLADWMDDNNMTGDYILITRAADLLRASAPVVDQEREELAQWLEGEARSCAAQFHDRITRAAALLRRPATAPVPVPVAERPWEREGWCDAEGFLWLWDSDRRWVRQTGTAGACNTWTGSFALPHWAISVPQPPEGGEVEP